MELIGGILAIAGMIVAVVGGIWLLVTIFTEGGALWGLGSILFSPISLIFVITHWEVSKKPFLIQLLGAAIMVVGIVASGPN